MFKWLTRWADRGAAPADAPSALSIPPPHHAPSLYVETGRGSGIYKWRGRTPGEAEVAELKERMAKYGRRVRLKAGYMGARIGE